MEPNEQPTWQATVSARLTKATADQIWPMFKDFFNFHKWFPSLATCYGIHGTNGEPGCIRYCAGFSLPSTGGTSWSKERLIAADDEGRCLKYEMVDSNIGFKSYVSEIQVVVPAGADGHDHDHGAGCLIEWCFRLDPVEGWAFDDLVRKYQVGLAAMAQRMDSAIEGLHQEQPTNQSVSLVQLSSS